MEAVDLELPERPVGLQRVELLADGGGVEAVGDPLGEPRDDIEVATDHRVDPEQLLEQRVVGICGPARVGGGSVHRSDSAVKRSGSVSERCARRTWRLRFLLELCAIAALALAGQGLLAAIFALVLGLNELLGYAWDQREIA